MTVARTSIKPRATKLFENSDASRLLNASGTFRCVGGLANNAVNGLIAEFALSLENAMRLVGGVPSSHALTPAGVKINDSGEMPVDVVGEWESQMTVKIPGSSHANAASINLQTE